MIFAEIDATAVWTALGVICGAITALAVLLVSLFAAENIRLRRRIAGMEAEKIGFMQALIDADHERRELQQTAYNSIAARRIRRRKASESRGEEPNDEDSDS